MQTEIQHDHDADGVGVKRPSHTSTFALRAATAAGALLLSAAPALAAPTCLDKAGQTVRCGTATALPVGEAPETDADLGRDAQADDDTQYSNLFGVACVVGGLFLLIGLMPDFDGWGPGERGDRDAAED